MNAGYRFVFPSDSDRLSDSQATLGQRTGTDN